MGSMSDDIEAVKATTQEWMKTAGETGDVDRMIAAIELEDTVKGLQSADPTASPMPCSPAPANGCRIPAS